MAKIVISCPYQRSLAPMTSINISLPDTMRAYVEEQVVQGGYETMSEYFRDLVRQDRRRKAKEKLEAMLLEGLNSGDGVEVTPEFWQQIRVREQ
jgi:antitoxin ParD1/3/4